MITSLGVLSFSSPVMLAGLAALPAIWWLLRLMPPRPETVAFPPTLLLLGLRAKERTPARSPWWLTLLRMAVAAAVILALAGPSLKPRTSVAGNLTKPLLVVVDNGWAAASRWAWRQRAGDQLAERASEAGQTLYLAGTAGPSAPLTPLSPPEFRQAFAGIEPKAYPGDRAALAKRLEQVLGSKRGELRVVWLADGIEDEGAERLRDTLIALAGGEKPEMIVDPRGQGALAVARAEGDAGAAIKARVLKADSGAREGTLAAVTAKGDRLALVPFKIGAGQDATEVAVDLPLELRNEVARLEIVGEASAGAVSLDDGTSRRRRVGVIASEDEEQAQPLLSPAHYVEKALSPYADLIAPKTANLDAATKELVARAPSVIILSDVGKLGGVAFDRLKTYVESGGMLIRFAGRRLENGGDRLLPAPLLEGGRSLGGALTWTTPQSPAPFGESSPFAGLAIPKDVTISRQVLADPARMPGDAAVWARLADGTPLVTAAPRGLGQIVFFHTTANPDWSNMPLSGLFVQMLRRLVDRSAVALKPMDKTAQAAGTAGAKAATGDESFLKPWRLLDGFGRLVPPNDNVKAIAAGKIDGLRADAGTPAGFYGPQDAVRALNIMNGTSKIAPLRTQAGFQEGVYAEAKTVLLTPFLYLAALALFLVDGAVCALLLGAGGRWFRKPALAALALAFLSSFPGSGGRAEPRPNPAYDAETQFALQASLETRFAYVLTGDPEADRVSKEGLSGLAKVLSARTAVEPGAPIGIDPVRDELVFFPLIYWPVLPDAKPLPEPALAKLDAYMKRGGLVIFDTKNEAALSGSLPNAGNTPLARLLGKLDLPPLERLPEDHVLTKSFYLLQSFPGRWDNGDLWVEAREDNPRANHEAVRTDGVSPIVVTSNDFAAAWALDDSDRPLYATVPGGEEQREMSYRAGVNIVMYALTGNYKADQVHVPAILERLGH